MNQFLKLHLGLIKYIAKTLPTKKTPKEVVQFFAQIFAAYIKETIRLYKNLFLIFDAAYRKQRKEFKKTQSLKKDLYRCLKMLKYLDQKLIKSGKSRQERRGFWRDFYTNAQIRTEVFKDLEKEIN
jgi:siroheme synthase (precorrin-2 oxidase/ferrochelatase)